VRSPRSCQAKRTTVRSNAFLESSSPPPCGDEAASMPRVDCPKGCESRPRGARLAHGAYTHCATSEHGSRRPFGPSIGARERTSSRRATCRIRCARSWMHPQDRSLATAVRTLLRRVNSFSNARGQGADGEASRHPHLSANPGRWRLLATRAQMRMARATHMSHTHDAALMTNGGQERHWGKS
jgi:hypothetical protein